MSCCDKCCEKPKKGWQMWGDQWRELLSKGVVLELRPIG